MIRSCVPVLVIFNAVTFPCSGVTGGVQLEGGSGVVTGGEFGGYNPPIEPQMTSYFFF